MSPFDSDDLTTIIKAKSAGYVVLRSPSTAEHKPEYEIVARFRYRQIAEAFLATMEN
jgi:hypothetical protein